MIGPRMGRLLRPAAVLACFLLLALGPLPRADADEWEDARKAFRAAQRLPEFKLRTAAYNDLLSYDGAGVVDEIFKALAKETNPAVHLAAAGVLGELRTPEARAAIVEVLARPKGLAAEVAILALGRQPGDSGLDALLAIVAGKDLSLAAQAAIALGSKGVPAATTALVGLLSHPEWQMRAAGARALTLLAGPVPPAPAPGQPEKPWLPEWYAPQAVLGPLADGLELSVGSERRLIIDALQRVSRQDFGWDVAAWKALAAGTDPKQITRKPQYPPYFFGIPIFGKRVVIVYDVSQCNDELHPFTDRARLQALCAVPGARPVPWFELRTTQHVYVEHAKRLIRDLDGKFDLFLYAGKVEPVFGKLTPTNAGTVQKAVEALEGIKVKSGVDTLGALAGALDVSGSKDSVAWSQGPDEVILMSCSIPWLAAETDQDVVGATVALQAGRRMVPVHTVGVGPHPFVLMKIVSPHTGGVYLDLSR
jgi:hypothetical protein